MCPNASFIDISEWNFLPKGVSMFPHWFLECNYELLWMRAPLAVTFLCSPGLSLHKYLRSDTCKSQLRIRQRADLHYGGGKPSPCQTSVCGSGDKPRTLHEGQLIGQRRGKQPWNSLLKAPAREQILAELCFWLLQPPCQQHSSSENCCKREPMARLHLEWDIQWPPSRVSLDQASVSQEGENQKIQEARHWGCSPQNLQSLSQDDAQIWATAGSAHNIAPAALYWFYNRILH